jgi:hypothetical protein
MKVLGKDALVPYPLGLEMNGEVLLKSYSPPYFGSMTEAVQAVADAKKSSFQSAQQGSGAWSNPAIGAQIQGVSDAARAATVAYCEYVWQRYGRFPAYLAPFRTVVGFQACHVDVEFYDKFYRPEALAQAQRDDFAKQTAATASSSR